MVSFDRFSTNFFGHIIPFGRANNSRFIWTWEIVLFLNLMPYFLTKTVALCIRQFYFNSFSDGLWVEIAWNPTVRGIKKWTIITTRGASSNFGWDPRTMDNSFGALVTPRAFLAKKAAQRYLSFSIVSKLRHMTVMNSSPAPPHMLSLSNFLCNFLYNGLFSVILFKVSSNMYKNLRNCLCYLFKILLSLWINIWRCLEKIKKFPVISWRKFWCQDISSYATSSACNFNRR